MPEKSPGGLFSGRQKPLCYECSGQDGCVMLCPHARRPDVRSGHTDSCALLRMRLWWSTGSGGGKSLLAPAAAAWSFGKRSPTPLRLVCPDARVDAPRVSKAHAKLAALRPCSLHPGPVGLECGCATNPPVAGTVPGLRWLRDTGEPWSVSPTRITRGERPHRAQLPADACFAACFSAAGVGCSTCGQ